MIHKMKGRPDHTHETVEQARTCERGFRSEADIRTDAAGSTRTVQHQDPCVCGPYDKCWEARVATARSHRDLFRAYND